MFILFLVLLLPSGSAWAASSTAPEGFPQPLGSYQALPGASLWQMLEQRVQAEPFNLVVTIIFFLAILHTFLAPKFMHLAHKYEQEHQQRLAVARGTANGINAREEVSFRAVLFHFLGEVEVIFGIWIIPLLLALSIDKGWPTARDYIGHGLELY